MSAPIDRAAEAVGEPTPAGMRYVRRALTAALDRDEIAWVIAAKWWDRNADDTDLWADLTADEQQNVIENLGASASADAVIAHLTRDAT